MSKITTGDHAQSAGTRDEQPGGTRETRSTGFVGRANYLNLFETIMAAPENGRVLIVHGPEGSGKSMLMREFEHIAVAQQAPAVFVDRHPADTMEAVRQIAELLRRQTGLEAKRFLARYKELKATQHAFQATGEVASARRLGVKAAVGVGARMVGLPSEAVSTVAEAALDKAAEWRISRQELRRLPQDFSSLASELGIDITERLNHIQVVILIDEYEFGAESLDIWVPALIEASPTTVFVVSGQCAFATAAWARLSNAQRLELGAFDASEAEDFLARYEIRERKLTAQICSVTENRPLRLAMLATAIQENKEAAGHAESLIDWLLAGSSETYRQLAIRASMPRYVDHDVLEQVATADIDSIGAFRWLRDRQYIKKGSPSWSYRPEVRAMMVESARTQSPRGWRESHRRLSSAHDAWCNEISEKAAWEDSRWSRHRLERAYHLLCADEYAAFSGVLQDLTVLLDIVVAARGSNFDEVGRWAAMLEQAGRDCGLSTLQSVGSKLMTAFDSGKTDSPASQSVEGKIRFLDVLTREESLGARSRAIAYRLRGMLAFELGRTDEAIADLDRSLGFAPDADSVTYAWRGELRRIVNKVEEALGDFDRALSLDPENVMALAGRGIIYKDVGLAQRAMADFDSALAIDPMNVVALTGRGQIHESRSDFADAIFDYANATECGSDTAFRLKRELLAKTDRIDELISELTAAIAEEASALALYNRGWALVQKGDYNGALRDLDAALRERAHRTESEESPSDFLSAIHAERGEALRLLGEYDLAESAYDAAVDLKPDNSYALASRGHVRITMGRSEAALEDLDRALRLAPSRGWAWLARARARQNLGLFEGAAEDYLRAADTGGPYPAEQCRFLTSRGRHDEAILLLNDLLEKNPRYLYGLESRGEAHLAAGNLDSALKDVDAAIVLLLQAAIADGDGDHSWMRQLRGAIYLHMGNPEDAQVEFSVVTKGYDAEFDAMPDGVARNRIVDDCGELVKLTDTALAALPDESAPSVAVRLKLIRAIASAGIEGWDFAKEEEVRQLVASSGAWGATSAAVAEAVLAVVGSPKAYDWYPEIFAPLRYLVRLSLPGVNSKSSLIDERLATLTTGVVVRPPASS